MGSPIETLTIRDAQQLFNCYSSELVAGYDELLASIMIEDVPRDMIAANDSYLSSLILVAAMLRRSKTSMRVLIGGGVDLFFKMIKDDFVRCLERFAKTRGFVKIIVVDSTKEDFLEELAVKYPNVLSILYATTRQPVNHFIVCDSSMVRDEEPHKALSIDMETNVIKAKIYFNNKEKARVTTEFFDGIWDQLEKPE